MGNLVIKAIAKIIQIPIVLFTSTINLPVVVVMTQKAPLNNSTVFVAFNQYGAGHYGAVTWNYTESDQQKATLALSEMNCNSNSFSHLYGSLQ